MTTASRPSFEKIIQKMPEYLRELERCPNIKKGSDGKFHPALPTDIGIYVFYEGGKPMYVGRSNRMRERLHEHGRSSSDHFSASFAFNIAKHDTMTKILGGKVSSDSNDTELLRTYIKLREIKRSEWESDPEFKGRFKRARERVRHMSIRVVEIENPIEQAIFEIYAHMKLGTKFNSFANH